MAKYRDLRLRLVETGGFGDRVDKLLALALDFVLGHARRLLCRLLLPATLLALAGCEGPLSTVDPAGPAARTIATLWWVMLIGSGAILALVLILLVLAFRRRSGPADERRQTRIWIIGLGLGFSMTILAALLAYGLVAGERLLPRRAEDSVSVQAQARQWSWHFAYQDAPGRVTENVLHIPAGRPVDVAITSADVVHSFWVPRLAGKLDAIPGHVNVLRLQADVPGSYPGLTAEYNGAGYREHKFLVVAHDETDWQAFLRGEAP